MLLLPPPIHVRSGATSFNLFHPLDEPSPSIEIFCHFLPLSAVQPCPLDTVSPSQCQISSSPSTTLFCFHALFVNLPSLIVYMAFTVCSRYCHPEVFLHSLLLTPHLLSLFSFYEIVGDAPRKGDVPYCSLSGLTSMLANYNNIILYDLGGSVRNEDRGL